MHAIPIHILRFADDHQPGWVDCELVDAHGVTHHFLEKIPVVSDNDLRKDTHYPQPGLIACKRVREWTDPDGRSMSLIDTSEPWGIESTTGLHTFVVLSADVRER